jgi:hypothetical protein
MKNTDNIPVIQTNHALDFADFRRCSDVFIETGTCFGRSVLAAMKAGYKLIKSVEAKDDFYEHCVKLFALHPEVQLFHGKSIDHLGAMLADLQGPAVIWLDAHVSGPKSAGYSDYIEKGEGSDYHQHTAIKKELEIVLAHSPTHTILIDDQNGGNASNAEYIARMREANPGYIFLWLDEWQGENFYKDKILVAIDSKLAPALPFNKPA